MFTKGGVRDRLPIQKRRLQLPLFWHWLSRQSRIMYSSDGQPTAHQSLSPTLPVQPTPPRKMWRFTQSGRNATTISRHPVWRLRQARSNSTAKWPSSSDWIVGTETYHMRITLTDGSTYKAGSISVTKEDMQALKTIAGAAAGVAGGIAGRCAFRFGYNFIETQKAVLAQLAQPYNK